MMQDRNESNNYIKILYFIIVASLVVAFLYYGANRAADDKDIPIDDAVLGGAYEVSGYEMNINVRSNHSYEVEEKISVNIPKPIQNIRFSVPGGNFRFSDIEVEDTAFYADIADNTGSVVIVDPIRLSETNPEFIIRYTIREFEDRDPSSDLFYFDALPPEWRQPIGRVDINVNFPSDFPWDDVRCYAGQFGVQDVNNKISFEADEKTRTVSIKGERIPENYGITVKADLPDGYWTGALNGGWVIITITAIMDLIVLILIVLWLVGGKDPRFPKTAQTGPIKGILPMEIGYIFNSELGIGDIVLLLIYFGRKGYLRISEYEPKRYRLYRGDDPVGEERMYRNAYNILFEDVYKDRAIDMEDIGDRLVRLRDALKDGIAAGYSSADSESYTPMSRIFRYISGALLSLGLGISNALTYRYEYLRINYAETLIIIALAAASLYMLARAIDKRESQTDESNILMELGSGLVMAGIIYYVASAVLRRTMSMPATAIVAVLSVVSVFFVIVMRARGRENAKLVMKVRQLRNFINHPTPRELLENHLADKNYYYDMLQYALPIGAEESWAISFLTLDVPAPSWYSHDVEGHALSNIREDETTLDYARDLKTFMRTAEDMYSELLRHRRRR